MRYIDMTSDGGAHWKSFALRKANKKLGIPPPRYGQEGKSAHDGLREVLAKRQGFLCGFCMGHLNCRDKSGNYYWHNVKVAHLEPQSPTDEQKRTLSKIELDKEEERRRKLGINIRNMVLACKGVTNGVLHCDTHQGNRHVTISFSNKGLMDKVLFPPIAGLGLEDSGSSKSDRGLLVKGPDAWQSQIGSLEAKDDAESLLNLNNKTLCRNRQEALLEFQRSFALAGKFSLESYRSWLNIYSTPNERGLLPAYCQVIVRALEKKIKQYN